jgi:hypothetical protein
MPADTRNVDAEGVETPVDSGEEYVDTEAVVKSVPESA